MPNSATRPERATPRPAVSVTAETADDDDWDADFDAPPVLARKQSRELLDMCTIRPAKIRVGTTEDYSDDLAVPRRPQLRASASTELSATALQPRLLHPRDLTGLAPQPATIDRYVESAGDEDYSDLLDDATARPSAGSCCARRYP